MPRQCLVLLDLVRVAEHLHDSFHLLEMHPDLLPENLELLVREEPEPAFLTCLVVFTCTDMYRM